MEEGRQEDREDGNKLLHVGGITAELGGVDPDIDETLLRLSGGP